MGPGPTLYNVTCTMQNLSDVYFDSVFYDALDNVAFDIGNLTGVC